MPSEHQPGIRTSAAQFTLRAIAVSLVFFLGILPTLNWLEFSSGSENLIVETVLEMHRGGPWIIPTLNGAPRTTKPPLTNWISAALVSPATITALSDPPRREEAYKRFAFEVRWPALAFACLTLIATAWLGRLLVSDSAGLTACAMMGTSLMFLRLGRSMTTDVQLALWVTVANVFFAMALFTGRKWIGCIIGGVALGLACMSKGPVAFAQTLAPIIAFIACRWWTGRKSSVGKVGWPPIIVGALLAMAVALPWPIWVLSRMSGQLRFWFAEVAEGGSMGYKPDAPWTYFSLIPLLLPWTGFFFLGLVIAIREKTERAVLAVALAIVPILVMTCFSQKNERYLLPMLAPAMVISAVGWVRRDNDIKKIHDMICAGTWAVVTLIGVGLPIAGATFLRTLDGSHWWSAGIAAVAALAALFIMVIAWRVDRVQHRGLIPAAIIVMLAVQALFMHGYASSKNGRSDGKPLADAIVASLPPDAEVRVYTSQGRFIRVPVDTTIYLNRIVRQTANPTTLPAVDIPRAILIHSRNEATLPAELNGWRVIQTVSKNQGIWSVCTQPSN